MEAYILFFILCVLMVISAVLFVKLSDKKKHKVA